MILSGVDHYARSRAETALLDGPLHLTVGGTVDAITAPFPDSILGLADMMAFTFEAAGANTGPVTLNVGGTGAKPLVLPGGAAMVAGDISAVGYVVECFYVAIHDHYHAQVIRQPSAAVAAKPQGAQAVGVSTRFARADHQHGGAIVGVTDGSNAAAGDVGEYIEAIVPSGSAIALVNGVITNVASILLTPGDWDIFGTGVFNLGATTSITRAIASVSNVSASIQYISSDSFHSPAFVPGTVSISCGTTPRRLSTNVNITVYLAVIANFTVSTVSAWGEISARRIR